MSKSITNNLGSRLSSGRPSGEGRDTPIQFVKGVGPKLGLVFKSRGVETVKDLLFFFPRTYEDRSKLSKISSLTEGVKSSVAVTISSQKQIPIRKLGRSMLEVRCFDDTGELSLKWFYPPRGLEQRLLPGARILVTGKVKNFLNRPEIVHPEMTWGVAADDEQQNELTAASAHMGRIVPVYIEIEEVPTKTLRKVLWETLEKFSESLPEDLPNYLVEKHGFPTASFAIRGLHFPPDSEGFDLASLAEFRTPSHQRLIYEEFLKFEFLMLRRRIHGEKTYAVSFASSGARDRLSALIGMLPFELTEGQKQSLRDILVDLAASHPMNRLIQGDVGSGKTAIALLSAAYVTFQGGQVALMVPTEILAEQHFKNAKHLFQGKLNVALLTGKTSGPVRAELQGRLAAGEPILLIGTHALLEAPVVFSRLSYVLIDEQHRFGVEQRSVLKAKGERVDSKTGKVLSPHSLLLTATPIPRTLALTAFGDLTVSSIRELPPGRSPVTTQVVREKSDKIRAYQHIRKELSAGRQAFFIYPLINESEAEGFTQLKSAVIEAELLAKEVFPEFSIGLLHGQLPSAEKEEVMQKFKRAETQILVSTTVVEVGVDVPNATIMLIEHSERFGLSQLHQLRGRVGRGKHQSYCFLFTGKRTEGTGAQRLEVLETCHDGFQIAEADLEIRGPGEFLGTRQAGGLPFRLANLV
ncbi:MAG: ATP-dependent DNA helicase RecG, partial [Bdellovibrionia bacterium]